MKYRAIGAGIVAGFWSALGLMTASVPAHADTMTVTTFSDSAGTGSCSLREAI